jgi:asparaginyl-tRNA synthetase
MTDWTPIKDILDGKAPGEVSVRGWIHRTRSSGKLVFATIRDATGIIQATGFKGNMENDLFRAMSKALVESSVVINGTAVEEARAPGGWEIQVKECQVVHAAEKFPITKDQSDEFLMDNRHLWIRSRQMNATFRVRSTLFRLFREYYLERGFFEIQPPMFQTGACEGGSTLFEVAYGERKGVYLSQSWQLYAEAMMYSLEKIFTVSPSFRAEKSRTRRHVSEFWHAEVEEAWAHNEDMMKREEGMIEYMVRGILEEHRRELEFLERDMTVLEGIRAPFDRIKYAEVLDMLREKGMELEWGDDFGYTEEKLLTSDRTTPFFITHFPREKGFYHRPDPEEPKALLCNDLLAPEGYGEIIGGGERIFDLQELLDRIDESGLELDDYSWYVDLRRYGSVPHSGFGLGLDRLLTWIIGSDHIKHVIPFPRTMRRVTP